MEGVRTAKERAGSGREWRGSGGGGVGNRGDGRVCKGGRGVNEGMRKSAKGWAGDNEGVCASAKWGLCGEHRGTHVCQDRGVRGVVRNCKGWRGACACEDKGEGGQELVAAFVAKGLWG